MITTVPEGDGGDEHGTLLEFETFGIPYYCQITNRVIEFGNNAVPTCACQKTCRRFEEKANKR